MNFSEWFQELRRRRVFRALVAYAIAAFAILQVIEPVMHGLALPEWVLKVTVIGLGLGLPITILLAWAYDLGPRGIERTPSPSGSRALRVLLLTGAGLLVASPVVIYYPRGRAPAPEASPAGPGGPSVAVLPFVNMSDDPGNEYFSEGLSEEILNTLASIPGLRVPARTSSFAFKGHLQDVPTIAAALRVANVLEGSVRKAGTRVRITAQLVSATDGYHLWSQTYERSLTDVFAVEDEISADIARALKVQLVPEGRGLAAQAGATTNPDAYEAYLLGRHALNQRSRASIQAAVDSFRKATALDPGFAPALADMAIATLLLGRSNTTYGEVPMREAIAAARPPLEKALALAPDRVEVLAASGFMESCNRHYQRALDLYDRALAINPSNGEVRSWRAMALSSLGRFDQILPAATEAVRVDPLSKIALFNLAPTLQTFGRNAEIAPVIQQLRALDEGWAEWALGSIAADRGDRPEAARHLLQAIDLGRDRASMTLAQVFAELGLREEALRAGGSGNAWILNALGDRPAALQAARKDADRDPDDMDSAVTLFWALYAAGQTAEAATLGDRLWKRGDATDGMHIDLLLLMADAARGTGQPDRAARYRDRAGEMVELARRSGMGTQFVELSRAELAVYDGRDEEALALLMANMASFPGPRSNLDLPFIRRAASRPDFQAAIKVLDGRLAEQRARVLRMICGPERVSAKWQPASGTCAQLTMAP